MMSLLTARKDKENLQLILSAWVKWTIRKQAVGLEVENKKKLIIIIGMQQAKEWRNYRFTSSASFYCAAFKSQP